MLFHRKHRTWQAQIRRWLMETFRCFGIFVRFCKRRRQTNAERFCQIQD